MLALQKQFAYGAWALLALWLLVNPQAVQAKFEIIEGNIVTERERFWADAKLNLVLDKNPIEAVLSGIPLILSIEIRLYRLRMGIWKERLATWHYRYQFRYHGLSGRFVLQREASGQLLTFTTLVEALDSISNVRISEALPDVIKESDQLRARLRVRLVKDNLPAPLRLLALFSPSWQHDSNWHQWKVAH